MEDWRYIPGFGRRYRISQAGAVEKRARKGWRELRARRRGGAVSYRMQSLDGLYHSYTVDRLLAMAFLGLQEGKSVVRHRNGDRSDHRLENLEVKPALTGQMKPGRRILKLDREGRVVAEYDTVLHAATANFLTESAIRSRCTGKVHNPYRLDGCTYQFADPL